MMLYSQFFIFSLICNFFDIQLISLCQVSLKNNIHRFSLPSEDLSISKLDEVLLKVFERKFVVKFIKKYQDPEGDLITCMFYFYFLVLFSSYFDI